MEALCSELGSEAAMVSNKLSHSGMACRYSPPSLLPPPPASVVYRLLSACRDEYGNIIATGYISGTLCDIILYTTLDPCTGAFNVNHLYRCTADTRTEASKRGTRLLTYNVYLLWSLSNLPVQTDC